MEFESLADLEVTNKHDWKIRVRVARKWKETSIQSERINGVHLILIDQYEHRMHGWIESSLLEYLDDKIFAGQNYEIFNFVVAPFTEKYKCFAGDIEIILTKMTLVTPLQPNSSLIPENIFYFTNLEYVVQVTKPDSHLIDIVGVIDDIKPMKHVTNTSNGPQYFKQFVVTDLIHKVKVFFWNELATSFEISLKKAKEEPVIIIISCCRMLRNEYNGRIAITNMPCTTFHMNANCDRVNTLQKRFLEVHGI